MNYLEALKNAIKWMDVAENNGDLEERALVISDSWLKVAAEIRAGAVLTPEQVNQDIPLDDSTSSDVN